VYRRNEAEARRAVEEQPRLIAPAAVLVMEDDLDDEAERLRLLREAGLGPYARDPSLGRVVPLCPGDETELSRWQLPNIKGSSQPTLEGTWMDGESFRQGRFVHGRINLMLTDRAIRCSVTEGAAQGGAQIGVWHVFLFEWSLAEIDWIGISRRNVSVGANAPVVGADALAALETMDIFRANRDWSITKGTMAQFGRALVQATADAQVDHEDELIRKRAHEVIVTEHGYPYGGRRRYQVVFNDAPETPVFV
jgi:hypothetical protein